MIHESNRNAKEKKLFNWLDMNMYFWQQEFSVTNIQRKIHYLLVSYGVIKVPTEVSWVKDIIELLCYNWAL